MKGHVIGDEGKFVLAVFLMDYNSGQWSRGYRILSRLQPRNFSPSLCDELRQDPLYDYFVKTYSKSV